MTKNDKRRKRVRTALNLYKNVSGNDIETQMIDLLTDLRHLANKQNFFFADVSLTAFNHWIEESKKEIKP